MTGQDGSSRDLARLVVSAAGSLAATGDRWEPYRLLDADGVVVDPVASDFRGLQASGRSAATVRRMAWISCGGSGSPGQSACRGRARPGCGPVTSAAGSRPPRNGVRYRRRLAAGDLRVRRTR